MMTQTELINIAKEANLVAIAQRLSIPLKKEGRYWRIPGHGGLFIYPKNSQWVWCQMSEGRGGDAISFLTSSPVSSMSFREAVEILTGGQWLSEGSKGFKGKNDHSSLKPEPQAPRHDIAVWTKQVLSFVSWCHRQLLAPSGADVMAWLREKRGLHDGTVKRFVLGWCPRQFFRTKRDWGLDDDGKMALPVGLVIPKFSTKGHLIGATIRRMDDAESKQWGRYYSLPSPFGREVWIINQEPNQEDSRAGGWPILIVEGELDGILLAQEVPDCLNIAVLGSAGIRPNNIEQHCDLWEMFTKAQRVFVALDNDKAGQRSLVWWLQEWKHTVALPPPDGHKDPTEAFLAGHDLKQWLMDDFDKADVRGWPLFSLAASAIGKTLTDGGQESC